MQARFSRDQMRILRKLVEDALRERVEGLRLGDAERAKLTLDESDPKRKELFFEEALVLIRSDLVGLYRALVVEEPEEALVEAAKEPMEEIIETDEL